MNLTEVTQLLTYAQNFDNRKITEGMISAWQEVLAGVPFDFSRQAVIEAFKDETVKWLEPKHVFRYAKPLMDRAKAQKQAEEEAEQSAAASREATSPPMCNHGKRLVDCGPCCKWFASNHETHPVTDIRVCKKCLDVMLNKKIPVTRQG